MLTGKKIGDKEYEHVLQVWNKFETKATKDYLDVYLKCDGLLLPDAFEKFRNNSLKNYGFGPSFYLSTTALRLGCNAILQKLSLNLFLV